MQTSAVALLLRQFWYFASTLFVLVVILNSIPSGWGGGLSSLLWLVLFLPFLAITTRRLRDANISGWFQLLWFIPVIGWILMLVMLSLPAVEFNRFNKTERKKEAKEHKDIKIKTNVTPSARETAVYVKTNTNKSKKTGKE